MTDISNMWLAVLSAAIVAVACGKSDNCPPPNYSPGDKFEITVNSIQSGETPCPEMPLGPGDSLVVTASSSRPYNPDSSGCYTLAATPEVPNFAKNVMKSCTPGNDQLGVQCKGVTAEGCTVTMNTGIGQVPSASQGVIAHTLFGFNTGGGWELDSGQVCSMSPECGLNQFDVRIG